MDGLQIANAFSSGLSDFGGAMQYRNLAAAYDANAGLTELDAQQVLADVDYSSARFEERGEKFIGQQVAMYAKSGVTFEGSPARVMLETEKNIRMDVLTMRNNAVRKANALGFQALQQKLAAGRARTRAVQKMGQGVLKMVGSYAQMAGTGGDLGGGNTLASYNTQGRSAKNAGYGSSFTSKYKS